MPARLDDSASARGASRSPACIRIGLLNNMADGALRSTERQFLSLLDAASGGMMVRVSLFALPDVPRAGPARCHIGNFYSGIDRLWDSHLDALIVTGAEPSRPNLKDEPYWGGLTAVLDWAERSTHSTILSCLSAHAAVLHFDGIDRHRLTNKQFGVFEFERFADHPLTARMPLRIRMPHSRWNEIWERDLAAAGYLVLTRAVDSGVDMFLKLETCLFLFFQGHPEYEMNTLLLEYRRDVTRYLRRESSVYPAVPQNCFDNQTTSELWSLRQRALYDRSEALLADFPAGAESRLSGNWRSAASCIYGHWLAWLAARKERRASLLSLTTRV